MKILQTWILMMILVAYELVYGALCYLLLQYKGLIIGFILQSVLSFVILYINGEFK